MRPTCWKVKVKKGTKLWTIWRNVWKGYQEKRFIRDGYLEMYRISVQVNLERYLTFFVQMLKRAPRKTGLFFFLRRLHLFRFTMIFFWREGCEGENFTSFGLQMRTFIFLSEAKWKFLGILRTEYTSTYVYVYAKSIIRKLWLKWRDQN